MIQESSSAKEEIKANFWEQFLRKLIHISKEFSPIKVALRIAGIYVILGALWILLSDKVLENMVQDKYILTLISMVKGWVFVFFTGVIIFALVYSALRRIHNDELKIVQSYEEITTTYEELETAYEDLTAVEEELRHIAYHDLLTDLPNRAALYIETEKLIRANPDSNFTLLFIDADNFKFINDTMGHDFGDQLVKLMGKRLGYLVKETCSIYRLGGDEFIIVHKNSKKKKDVEVFASHVISGFKEPFKVGDSVLHINISIGVSVYPENGRDINELLRCADIAMYRAKEAGRNRYMVYTQSMNEIVTERMLIEKHLHTALKNNEFKLFYQPQFDIKENMVTGFEALLRWNSQELGLVSPLKFIKVAEETHLIISLGTWALWKACAFIKKLHTQGHTDLSISVNISILQLLQNDFVDSVLEVLEVYNLKPESLELEITESILMESYETIEVNLKLLCDRGIKIALDDFGKGYSSLSYLKQLPITTLKIDKSFIDSISSESVNKSLTGQIVEMGRSMGLSVVAEGVETQEQFNYLIRRKCHKIQGYFFSKPLSERDAEELVVNRKIVRH